MHYDEQRERDLEDLLIRHARQFEEAGRTAQESIKNFIDSAESQDFIFLNYIIENKTQIEQLLIGLGHKPYNV